MSTTASTTAELPASLLTGDNAAYVDQLYTSWRSNPTSVPPEWSTLFAGLEKPSDGERLSAGEVPRFPRSTIFRSGGGSGPASVDVADVMAAARRQTAVAQLINAFRVRGHKQARIDPLGRQAIEPHPELAPEFYGLSADFF